MSSSTFRAFENETFKQDSSDSENDDEGSDAGEGDETDVEEGDETDVEEGDETNGEEEDETDVEGGDAMEVEDDGDVNKVIDDEMNNLSSDGESEVCAVCLNKFIGQELGSPETCNHTFCLQCLVEWSKNTNTCPIDRTEFSTIFAKFESSGSVTKKIVVEVSPREPEDALPEDTTACEVCRSGDREHRLLLCDACDLAYHCECLDPPLWRIPTNEWFCPPCATILNKKSKKSSTLAQQRVIPRTIVSETVRMRIQRLREGSDESEYPTPTARPLRLPVQRKQSAVRTVKRKTVRRRPRRRIPQKTVVLARTKQSVLLNGKTRVRVNANTQVKYKRRRRRRRKYKKRKTPTKQTMRTMRSLLASKPLAAPSTKQRIADRLGLHKPPPGHQIPYVKSSATSSAKSSRAEYLPTLALFGNKNQLMDFGEDFSDEINKEINTSLIKSNSGPSRCSTAADFDLLGNIMAEQSILHRHSKDMTIGKDGSLKLKEKPVSVKSNVNAGPIKKELQSFPSVKNKNGILCKENIFVLSNKPKALLIKNDGLQSENANVSRIKLDENKVNTHKVHYADNKPRINPNVSSGNKVFNKRLKTEVRNDFHNCRDIVRESFVSKQPENRKVFTHQKVSISGHGNSLRNRRSTKMQNGVPLRMISCDPQLKKEKSNFIKKEKSCDSLLPLQLSERAVKTERTISKQKTDHGGHLSSYRDKIISANMREKLSIKSNCINRGKSIKIDSSESMIDEVSKQINKEMNKIKLERQINLLPMKTFGNEQQRKDNCYVDKVPPAYPKQLKLGKTAPSKYLNCDGDHVSNRNSSVESNKVGKRGSLDFDPHSKRTVCRENMDTFINKSFTTSWEREGQLINDPDIRVGRNLQERNGVDMHAHANRLMSQQSGNVISSEKVKMEALAPLNSEDMFANQSQSAFHKNANSCSRAKIETLNSGNNICTNLSSPPQESVNCSNIKIKMEPFFLSDNEDVIKPLQSPSEGSISSEISNLKVKIEPVSPSNYEDSPATQSLGLSEEWENINVSNTKMKMETLPSDCEDHAHLNQQQHWLHGSPNSNINNVNVKVEPVSPTINEDDVYLNQLPHLFQESENCNIKNVKVEPHSSAINKCTSANQPSNLSQESTSPFISNTKVKVEPFSTTINEGNASVNQSPRLFQESTNCNINNVNVKIEPHSSTINKGTSANQSSNLSRESKSPFISNTKVKVEPLSTTVNEDNVSENQSPWLFQESTNGNINNVNVKIEPHSSTINKGTSANQSSNLSRESKSPFISNRKIKVEPCSTTINEDDAYVNQSPWLFQERANHNMKNAKVEPLSPTINKGTSANQSSNLSREKTSLFISNTKVKIEPLSATINEDTYVNQSARLFQESTNCNINNVNVKIEPHSSTINKGASANQSSNLSWESKSPFISNTKVKVEPPSTTVNEADASENQSARLFQESTNCNINNVNVKIEPHSSTINKGASANQSSNLSWESKSPFISNTKVKVEPPSTTVNEADASENQSPQLFQESTNCNINNVNVKIEPHSSTINKGTSANQSSNLSRESKSPFISNRKIKVEPCSTTINEDDAYVNQSPWLFQERANHNMKNAKVEPLSPTINKGTSANQSSNLSREKTSLFISNTKVKVEPLSATINEDTYVNQSARLFQESTNCNINNVNVKIEPHSSTINKGASANQSSNLSWESKSPFISNTKVKVEPPSTTVNEADASENQSARLFQESTNCNINNVNVKIEPHSSTINKGASANQSSNLSWESKSPFISNTKVKVEPPSTTVNEADASENQSPQLFQESTNCNINNVNVKIEPHSSTINKGASANQSSNLSWESKSPFISNRKVKVEPCSTTINEDDAYVNQSPWLFQERANRNIKNAKVEPLSPTINKGTSANQSSNLPLESTSPFISNTKVKVEPLSATINDDGAYVNQSPRLFQESTNCNINNVNVKIEPHSSAINKCTSANKSLSLSQESTGPFISNTKVKLEPLSATINDDDTYVNQSPRLFQESTNCNINNVNVKIEPHSSAINKCTSANQPSNLFQESTSPFISNTKVKIEPFSTTINEGNAYVNQSARLFQESANCNINNVNVKIEPHSSTINKGTSANQSSNLSRESTSPFISNTKVKVEPPSTTINEVDAYVNQSPWLFQESPNRNIENSKVEPLSPTINKGTSANQSSNLSRESTSPFISNTKVKVEPLSPSLNDTNVSINKSEIQQSLDQDTDTVVKTVVKLEKSPLDDFDTRNCKQNTKIIPKRNIKTEIFEEEPDCVILYETQDLKLENNNLSSLNVFSNETLIIKECGTNSVNAPDLIVEEIECRKPNSYKDSDEVLILFENQVSKKRKIKMKKEENCSETSSHLHHNVLYDNTNTIERHQFSTSEENHLTDGVNVKLEKLSPVHSTNFENMVTNFDNTSTLIKEERNSPNPMSCQKNVFLSVNSAFANSQPLFSPSQGEKHTDSKKVKVKAEIHSPEWSIKSEYSTHLDFNAVTVKSEIISPLADFTDSGHSENARQSSINNFRNENNLNECHSGIIIADMKIKMESAEERKFSNLSDDLHKSSLSTLSDKFPEVTKLQEASNYGGIITNERKNDYLKEAVGNYFSQPMRIENSRAHKLQIPHPNELNERKRNSDSERKNGKISAEYPISHSGESTKNELKRKISRSETVYKRSKQNNEFNSSITNNGKIKNTFVDLNIVKIEDISKHANDTIHMMDMGHSSLNCHNNSDNSQSNWNCSPGSVQEKELVGPIKIKVEKCSPVTSPNCNFSLNSCSNLDAVKSEPASLFNAMESNSVKSEILPVSESFNLNHEEHSHISDMPSGSVKVERRKMDQKPVLEDKNTHISKCKKRSNCGEDLKMVNSPHEHKHKKKGTSTNAFSRIILLKQNFNASKTEVKQLNNGKSKIKEDDEDLKQKIEKEVKRVLYPFYKNGTISKKTYYDILHKSVPKVLLNCNNVFSPDKIKKLVCAYVSKLTKSSNDK